MCNGNYTHKLSMCCLTVCDNHTACMWTACTRLLSTGPQFKGFCGFQTLDSVYRSTLSSLTCRRIVQIFAIHGIVKCLVTSFDLSSFSNLSFVLRTSIMTETSQTGWWQTMVWKNNVLCKPHNGMRTHLTKWSLHWSDFLTKKIKRRRWRWL